MDNNGYWYSGIHGQTFRVGYGYTWSIPYPWPSLAETKCPKEAKDSSLLKVLITVSESPSTITLEKPRSEAKAIVLTAAIASASFGIFSCRHSDVTYGIEAGCNNRLWWKDAWPAGTTICVGFTQILFVSKFCLGVAYSHCFKFYWFICNSVSNNHQLQTFSFFVCVLV